jgi:hypothetical protein
MHAFLSPSSYHWIRYDEDKLADRFRTSNAARRGSQLHEYASMAIRLGIKQSANGTTISSFVNDVIGFRMESEQVLFYSGNCFGTADAIGFRRIRGHELPTLRIYDLKTGENEAKVDQLLVYAALFCLEYGLKPFEVEYDLRIYQNDAKVQWTEEDFVHILKDEDDIAVPIAVAHVMDKIVTWDRKLDELRQLEGE